MGSDGPSLGAMSSDLLSFKSAEAEGAGFKFLPSQQQGEGKAGFQGLVFSAVNLLNNCKAGTQVVRFMSLCHILES